MKNNKHIITALLATVLVFSILLTACNKGDDNSPSGETDVNPSQSGLETPSSAPDTASSDFEYHNDAALGGIVITKYIGKSDTVKVPEEIDGKPVVMIDDCAFQNCSSLINITTLYFGGTFSCNMTVTKDNGNMNISSEDKGLFSGCDSLVSLTVIIPDGVTKVDDYAFWNCRQLTDVLMSESVVEIGDYVFSYCDSLKNVRMPYNGGNFLYVLTESGEDYHSGYYKELFNGCDSLENVIVYISGNITKIDDEAFAYFNELTDVLIPDSVTSIGYSVFRNCVSLKNVTIPYNGGSFNDLYLFEGCEALENVTVNVNSGVAKIDKSAFVNYGQITSIHIPDTVTEIGEMAFWACRSLTDITIPNGVTLIEHLTFADCSSLTSITIPNSVTVINGTAFLRCDSLEKVTIGNGLTSIEAGLFLQLESLKSITMGNGVTSIGDTAFNYCISLEHVVLSDKITSIGYRAFAGCQSLTSVIIPDGVITVGSEAFDGIPDLTVIYKGVSYLSEKKVYNEGTASETTSYIMPKAFYDAFG